MNLLILTNAPQLTHWCKTVPSVYFHRLWAHLTPDLFSQLITSTRFALACTQIRRHSSQRVQTGNPQRWGWHNSTAPLKICAYFFDPKTLGFISATVLRLSCRRYQMSSLNRFKTRLAGFFCSLALANFGCGVFDHLHPERGTYLEGLCSKCRLPRWTSSS